MSKKLFGKFFIFLLVVGLLFAVAPTRQAQAATVVTTEAELRNVLDNTTETQIELGTNFTLSATVNVNRAVSIDGKGHTITGPAQGTEAYEGHGFLVLANNVSFSNLTITSSGRSNLVFYRVTGGIVTNVTLSNAAHAGMIVNGSQVTITSVTTSGNVWGGINVDQGVGVTEIPLLTVTNVTTHTSPTAGITPAIWVDKGNAAWVAVGDLYTVVAPPNGYLVFYDNTEFATIAANFPIHNESRDIYYATIQDAINAAAPGNTITVNGTHVLTSVVNVNKAVTLTCATGAKIQVSGTGDRFDVSAAATIQDCEIQKTDEVGPQEIIRLRASGITIKNNTIWGYWDIADSYVSRAMVINAGGFSDILITGNEIYGLRQPAYISGTHTGTISNNYVHGTKGWVLEGGNLTFTGNTWANNVGDIAILGPNGTYPGVPTEFYTDIVAMSAANNGAVIEDQRMSPALLSVVYVDDSAAAGGNGTQATPYQTIQAGINRVISGGTVHVAAGTYNLTTAVQVDKEVTITGPTTGEATVIGVGGGSGTTTLPDKVFEITAPNVTIENLSLTLASMPGTYTGMISVPDSSGPGIIQGITISNNKMFLPQQSGAMGTWWGQGINLGRYVGGAVISGNEIYNTRSGIVVSYNSQVNITNNVIYNTKGGIMNYTGSLADAANRVMTGNSWGTVHNEWDIVWNTGGAPYDMDMNIYVLQVSQANNDAYVCSLMSTLVPQSTLTGNRSHVFAATTGTTTVRYDNGNINLPYAKIQDAIDAVVPGGKVIVAAGTYAEDLEIGKTITILGPNVAISPNGGARVAEAIVAPLNEDGVADPAVLITASNITVTLKGLTFDMVNTLDDSDRFVESINKTGVTMVVEKNQFLNAPSCINGNWYITGTTNLFSLTLKDNYFYGSKDSNGISLWGDGHTVDIQNNVWKDNGAWAVNFNNVTGTFSGNQVLDTEDNGTEWSNEQAGFLFASTNALTLTNNTFDGLPNPSIRIYDSFKGTLTATGNIFSNIEDPTMGVIRISDGAVLTGVNFEKNQFLNNPIVVQNLGTGTASLDVTPNWWGSIAGPEAGAFVGTAEYIPWCGDAECSFLVYVAPDPLPIKIYLPLIYR